MIVYKNCKIYRSGDPLKQTVTTLDIESETALSDFHTFTSGDALEVDSSKTITTTHDFDYMKHDYNIIIPDVGDLKITGVSTLKENRGEWKPRFRYTLTVTG